MRLLIGTISAAALLAGGAFIAGGYLNTRRAEHRSADRHRAVHAMSLQDLAAAIARCDAAPDGSRDAGYCEEVARELDERPLEIVEVKPAAPGLPAPR